MRDWSRSWTSHAAGACALVLIASVAGHAQLSIAEINPDAIDVRCNDPDGASGGRVNGLGRPSNAVFYAASEWGGIYKSTDAGRKWARLDAHIPTATWDVEVSPADANRVVATSFYDGRVTASAGINVSTNAGAAWTRPPSPSHRRVSAANPIAGTSPRRSASPSIRRTERTCSSARTAGWRSATTRA